jgi:hypothetical protein
MKTWHYEIIVLASVLCIVNLIAANNLVNWITTLAILITFNHSQIADRLMERQKELQVRTVECVHKLVYLFLAKETVWITAFLVMRNYAAIVGSIVLFLYPFWRKIYRKKIRPLPQL